MWAGLVLKGCTQGQEARCGATDVLERNRRREIFLKAYDWEIATPNVDFLVDRECNGQFRNCLVSLCFQPRELA